ncbi:MAG: hypothetical protein LBN92_00485, partial [Treponema sp.]|nr:hypothetical protein [Treponema sp.]
MKKILTIAAALTILALVSYPGLAQGDGSAAPAVYVAGNYSPQGEMGPTFPCYWKDGTRIDLSRDGLATGIAVSGGSVYVSGWNGYWKDKTKVNFTGGTVA